MNGEINVHAKASGSSVEDMHHFDELNDTMLESTSLQEDSFDDINEDTQNFSCDFFADIFGNTPQQSPTTTPRVSLDIDKTTVIASEGGGTGGTGKRNREEDQSKRNDVEELRGFWKSGCCLGRQGGVLTTNSPLKKAKKEPKGDDNRGCFGW